MVQCKNLVVWANLFQLVIFVLLLMMYCLFQLVCLLFICLNWIVCNLMCNVQIVMCVKILYLEIFVLGCVTARFCIFEKSFSLKIALFLKVLLC